MTDHQIWFVHFAIGPDSPLFRTDASAKVVFQHADATTTKYGWNAILEMGADWNQGRYVDPDLLAQHEKKRGKDLMLCELVFLTASPLLAENYVMPGATKDGRPMRVFMNASTRASVMFDEMTAVKDALLGGLGAVHIEGEDENLTLQEAGIGGAGHELGSLRLGEQKETSVLNSDLRFWGVDNLWACDLSVFPTSPSANPTLALGGLALRLADKLKEVVQSAS